MLYAMAYDSYVCAYVHIQYHNIFELNIYACIL